MSRAGSVSSRHFAPTSMTDPLLHRGLGELLRDGTETITPMTTQELERAIARPAEQQGVALEPALVAELVREVTDRSGALPLLQYTLTELFDARRGERIDFGAYTQIGGVSGALVEARRRSVDEPWGRC